MRYALAFILILTLPGCALVKEASTNAIDEKVLAETLVDELDKRKDETIRLLREELEKLSESVNEDLAEKVVQPSLESVRIVVADAEARLSKKHEEFLGRLPYYAVYALVLFMIVAILADVGVELIRWLIAKEK